ncbi:hypothetical protein LUR56_37925 [Streptomyces sp. MT29]|nr:hypothetical protein [Streptomyces sp. MT29]
MRNKPPRLFAAEYDQAAQRARTLAEIARDRFAPPKTISVLREIAALLDRVAEDLSVYETRKYIGLSYEASRDLCEAEALALAHTAARFAPDYTLYVLQPLNSRPFPLPDPLHPVTRQFARREARATHRIWAHNAEGEQLTGDPSQWLRLVMAAWRDWATLAVEVEVDNARPDNRRARP